MRRALAVAALAVILAGCAGQALAPTQQTTLPTSPPLAAMQPCMRPGQANCYSPPPATPEPSGVCSNTGEPPPCPTSAPQPTDQPSDVPSDAPSGPSQQQVGDVVDITCGGADCLQVTLDKVAFAKSYKDPQGFLNDTPQTKGDVFLAFHVVYKSTGPDANYNEFGWAVYANDNAVDTTTFVEHGPKPELSAGQLPQGKTASGWIVQEVPGTDRLVVAYQPGTDDIFEVVVRSK